MTEQNLIIQDLRREVERELPSTYLWFSGTGLENVFRSVY